MKAASMHLAGGKISRLASGSAFALLLLAAAPAVAQSMLGAPGLSPVAPSGPVAAPPAPPPAALVTPPEAGSAASTCEADMMKFQERRQASIESINKIVAAGKGKIDPVASCPKLRSLVAVEAEMRAWMIKQKDWCSIPDQVIESMKEGTGKTSLIADRACAAAAQMRRQQQSPAGGGAAPAMKLPTGPL